MTAPYTSLVPGLKVCLDCKEQKPLSQFHKSRTGKQGRQARCGDCANTHAKTWRKAHPYYSAQRSSTGYFSGPMRWKRIEQRYGLTEERFHELEAEQGHQCAICGDQRRLVVDHDHTTGQVRGLLCNRCNTSLGHIEDGAWLEAATAYLSRPGM